MSGFGRYVPSPASPSDEREQQRVQEARFARQEAHNEAEAARRAGTPAPPGPPPASVDALASLPDVIVTEADVLDEANSTCCVCIDDFDEGGKATRLPCGHLLHRPCALRWLGRHCTCPTCRYELQSDDYIFEQGRPARMAAQRPRYRREALESKTVHELRRLSAAVGVDSRGCLEKSDLVERLAASGRIEVFSDNPTGEGSQRSAAAQSESGSSSSSSSTSGNSSSSSSSSASSSNASDSSGNSSGNSSGSNSSPTTSTSGSSNSYSSGSSSSGSNSTGTNPEFTLEELEGMGVGALRQLMTILGGSANGLRPETCLEKSDMVQQIVDSGTVDIMPEVSQSRGAEEEPPSEGAAAAEEVESESSHTASGGGTGGPIMTLGELNALGVGALRSTMAEHGVDATGCVEKADLVQRLLASGTVRLVMDHEAAAAVEPRNIYQ